MTSRLRARCSASRWAATIRSTDGRSASRTTCPGPASGGTTHLIPPFTPPTNILQTKEKWLDTLRLRAGYTSDRWFLYATGGAAFADVGINLCSPEAVACGSSSKTVTGWTAGVGAEYAFRKNWSAKLEYLHVDLGTTFFPEIVEPNGVYISRDVKLTHEIVRGGVNYKFDWPHW
jgi:opacity protein-like surface antigen